MWRNLKTLWYNLCKNIVYIKMFGNFLRLPEVLECKIVIYNLTYINILLYNYVNLSMLDISDDERNFLVKMIYKSKWQID